MKISNRVCLFVALAFLPFAYIIDLSLGQIAIRYGLALILAIVLLLAFNFGGGAAKLTGAIFVWFGLDPFFAYFIAVAFGLLVLITSLASLFGMPKKERVAALPYLILAFVICFPMSSTFEKLQAIYPNINSIML